MEQMLREIATELERISSALGPSVIQWITLGIALASLILLLFYTHYTRKIANSTVEVMREGMRPIVTWGLVSGKSYFTTQAIQKTPNLIYDTRCKIRNFSKYNVSLSVNLNLKLDGKHEVYNDLYSGKTRWPLNAYQGINGHFNLSDKFNLQNFNKISIDLEVTYQSEVGIEYRIPKQLWYFNKTKQAWVSDIGIVV